MIFLVKTADKFKLLRMFLLSLAVWLLWVLYLGEIIEDHQTFDEESVCNENIHFKQSERNRTENASPARLIEAQFRGHWSLHWISIAICESELDRRCPVWRVRSLQIGNVLSLKASSDDEAHLNETDRVINSILSVSTYPSIGPSLLNLQSTKTLLF